MLRLEGIYDKNCLVQVARNNDVKALGFDFRPTSFNFLQQHRFMDLLDECYSPGDLYYMRYENEKDFVIRKTLDDLSAQSIGVSEGQFGLNQFILEFSCQQDFEAYDQFYWPYYWNFSPHVAPQEVYKARFLRGLVIDYSLLEELHRQNTLYQFSQNFYKQYFMLIDNRRLDIVLRIDWDVNLLPSILELFDFRFLSLCVNNKVEACYRQIDSTKMGQGLSFVNRFVIENSARK